MKMAGSTNSLLEAFKNRHATKSALVVKEAFRLVNLYRSLSCFESDFVDKYNQMLLSASPAVRRQLNTFMGGEEVADYLEFLEQNVHASSSEETSDNVISQKGYLPTPEEDIPVMNKAPAGVKKFSEEEWEKMKVQKEALIEQTQTLLNALDKLGRLSASSATVEDTSAETREIPSEKYSEIIEETVEEK